MGTTQTLCRRQGGHTLQAFTWLLQRTRQPAADRGKGSGCRPKHIPAVLGRTRSPIHRQSAYSERHTWTMKQNEGEVPQYYVKDSHEGIVSAEVFEPAQYEYQRRREQGGYQSHSASPFSGHIVCGECGACYGHKVWHSNDRYRRLAWYCLQPTRTTFKVRLLAACNRKAPKIPVNAGFLQQKSTS